MSNFKQQTFIFGENHSEMKEILSYYNQIRKLHKEFHGNIILLHELLYQDFVMNKDEASKRLKESGNGQLADPRINIDIYQLLFELNVKGIGIEYPYHKKFTQKQWDNLSIKEQFKLREDYMLTMINHYSELNEDNHVVVIVGDTHLRTIKTDELGDTSPIYNYFKDNPNSTIIRSQFGEIK